MKITIDFDEKNAKDLPEYENLEDLIFSKLGYDRVSIYSNLSEEKKKIFDAEIIDAMKKHTVIPLEKKVGMKHYWRKNEYEK